MGALPIISTRSPIPPDFFHTVASYTTSFRFWVQCARYVKPPGHVGPGLPDKGKDRFESGLRHMDYQEKLKTIWLAIHRGEEILFDYHLRSGKTIIGRTTKPIDIDHHMTMFGLDGWNGAMGIENAYKIQFMDQIEVKKKDEGYISDQYDPTRSELKNRQNYARI